MQWNIIYVVLHIMAIISLKAFAQATAAQLSRHVQTIVAITLFGFAREQGNTFQSILTPTKKIVKRTTFTPTLSMYMSLRKSLIQLLRMQNQYRQEETDHPTHTFRRLFRDLLSMGWRGCASTIGVIKLPSCCSCPKTIMWSIHILLHMQ